MRKTFLQGLGLRVIWLLRNGHGWEHWGLEGEGGGEGKEDGGDGGLEGLAATAALYFQDNEQARTQTV